VSAKINIQLDGKEYQVNKDMTILEAAREVGHNIPTLCYHKDLSPTGNCGVCVVEVDNSPTPKRACITPIWEGMKENDVIKYRNTEYNQWQSSPAQS